MTAHDPATVRRDVTLADRCAQWAAADPSAPCLTSGETTRTRAEVMERCQRVATGLRSSGRGAGARVLYVGRNSSVFVELMIASSMAGTVITAVNWRLAATEMRELVEHSTAELAFVEEEFADLWAELRPSASVQTVPVGGRASGEYERWMVAHEPAEPGLSPAPDDIVVQMYTSGTSGLPKGALFSHAALQGIDVSAEATGTTAGSTVLVVLPIFHAGGATAAAIALRAGAHLVISADTSADALAEAVERHRITAMTLVPTLLREMLASPAAMARDLSSLEVITYCGSPISPALLTRCLERFRCGLAQVYGLTEVNGISVLSIEDHLDREHPERLRSVGRPFRGIDLRIVDPLTGREAAAGEVGEICVKAPTVMTGYFRAPERTAEAFTDEGFLRTGDGGYVLDGYLYLRDRIKDMIITGGENVYPVEVEKVLAGCPGVADVAVVGVPSEQWGETVKAFVVSTPDGSTDGAAIIQHARQHLAAYKCPTSVELVDALPRNASGKLLKRVIREDGWVAAHRLPSPGRH